MKAFFHPSQNKHCPLTYLNRGQMRPPQELPERCPELLKGMEICGVQVEEPADHGMHPISKVHDLGYLRFLASAHERWPEDWGEEVMSNIFVREPNHMQGILAECARYQADGSCPIGAGTWEAAYWSAQSALSGADELLGGAQRAYAMSRPPGHHARRDAAGGFCYLNNAAIAAEALRSRFNRVAILDPDMHHGQGIQEIFYERDDVLYISIHGDTTNFYPVVSGHEQERGKGAGYGYNINMPMPHGSPESTFFERMDEAEQAINLYEPEVLVVSLGFDIYEQDPQAKVSVSNGGFRQLGEQIKRMNLPVLVVQEGGYYLEALAENARAFFEGLD